MLFKWFVTCYSLTTECGLLGHDSQHGLCLSFFDENHSTVNIVQKQLIYREIQG